jgi:hypothetical protein
MRELYVRCPTNLKPVSAGVSSPCRCDPLGASRMNDILIECPGGGLHPLTMQRLVPLAIDKQPARVSMEKPFARTRSRHRGPSLD